MRQELTDVGRGKRIDAVLLEFIPKSELDKINEVLGRMRDRGILEETVLDKYRTPLIQIRYLLDKNFMDCKREDIRELNTWIIKSKYKLSRRRQLRNAIATAYRIWLNADEDEKLEILKDLKPTEDEKKKSRKEKTYMPDMKDLIKTNSDMDEKVIRYVSTDRDKFYFGFRWDTASRDCEAESSRWGDIEEDENGNLKAHIINAKNSGDLTDRKIILSYSLPYLHSWKRAYKEIFNVKTDEELKDLYIFRKPQDIKNEPLKHGHYAKLCREIKKKSGISDFSPKMFRKYCISRWEREGIPEAIIRRLSGHVKNSRAIQHYSYHQQNDIDNAILKLNGMEIKNEVKSQQPSFILCRRCQRHNKVKSESCEFCNFPLTQKGLLQYEEKISNTLKITENLINGNEELKQSILMTLKNQIIAELRADIEKDIKKDIIINNNS